MCHNVHLDEDFGLDSTLPSVVLVFAFCRKQQTNLVQIVKLLNFH